VVQRVKQRNGNPERSNRIPHTDHFNRHILTPIILPKLSRHRSTVATVHVEGMTRTGVVETGRSWNPAPRQHPPKAPGCEGTPAESKQVQAITGFILFAHELITIAQLELETCSSGSFHHPHGPDTIGADTVVVQCDLALKPFDPAS
jgi:hypothetical protein